MELNISGDNYGCFVQDGEEAEQGGSGSGRSQSGEKEEGEVADHGEEGDGERFKFWVKVDIFRAAD
jgi:hypothetical protein